MPTKKGQLASSIRPYIKGDAVGDQAFDEARFHPSLGGAVGGEIRDGGMCPQA